MSAPATPPSSDETELLLGYLHRQREDVIATVHGLDEEQVRWTPEGRLLPIIGIINHLTHVEWRWINGRYLRQEFPPRTEEFRIADDRTLADVIGAYRSREVETERIVREAPSLTVPCLGTEGSGRPAHVLLGYSEPFDLRWIVLHLIEETAHHAGHADATREMLDGTKMGP